MRNESNLAPISSTGYIVLYSGVCKLLSSVGAGHDCSKSDAFKH